MATSKEKTARPKTSAKARPRKKVIKPKKKRKEKKISYHRQPEEMPLATWQAGLRKQYGKESAFTMTNIGGHRVFSDWSVRNPETGNTYKVAIRSRDDSANFCSCMDYKTNRLGVCKHIGFVLHKLENMHVKRILKAGYVQSHSSIYLDYRNGRKVKLSIGTEDREEYEKLAKKYFDSNFEMTATGFSKFEKMLTEAKKINGTFRCYDDALEFVLGQRDLLSRNAKIDRLFAKGTDSPLFDKLTTVKLYGYQKEGVLFAARAGRCLIADEMGLGKTMQAIAAAELYQQKFGATKVLVTCPTSLKYQWKTEIERFTKNKAHVVEGTIIKRRQQYAEVTAPYMIVGYHTVKNDLQQLNDLDFDILILDEAQRIKNWATQISTAIKKLKTNYAFVLTGTPLENKLEELYSIMQVIDQFRLPPLYLFLEKYQVKDENSGRVVGFKDLKNISHVLSDVLLRRTKKQVLTQLPKRMDKTLLVPMTEDQMIIHDEYKEVVAKLVAKWMRQRFLNEKDRKRLMLSMSQMRMVCDSTYVLDQTTRHDTKITELMAILEEFFTNDDRGKVVIFSQWKRMLDLVKGELEDRDVGFQYLHGGVPSKKRGDLIKCFKEDPDCHIFLSTDAGGVGLNLQAASLVINLDIPWNPAVLEQRIARVWRMGQENAVQVINLVSAGTIEHRMLGVLKFKASLAKGVLDDGEDVIFMEKSRFKEFMGKMVDLTGGQWVSDTEQQATMEEETAELAPQPAPEEQPEPAMPTPADKQPAAPSPIPGDDDVPVPVPAPAAGKDSAPGQAPLGGTPSTPEELVQSGVSFLTGLAKTLSSPEKTQQLVSSLTAKDEKTGQTYLRIPVENEAVVSNALQVLGGLFKAFGQ
ncbi:MAG TPA: ATP-dependent helicase [Bacteroidetes bacterium]|nr:ATP-dependent helicase [Bacteroidota bacterium]